MITGSCPSPQLDEQNIEQAEKNQANQEVYAQKEISPRDPYHLNRIYSIFNSYCLTAVAGPIAAYAAASLVSTPVAAVVSMASFSYYVYNNLPVIGFEISLLYVMIRAINWWDRISDHLILGGLPIINEKAQVNDVQALKEQGVQAVLCLNQLFELETGLTKPATQKDWREAGIIYKRIECEDFKGVTKEQMEEAIEFLLEQKELKHNVYVHCKAGHGRSVMVIVYFLYLYGCEGKKFDSIRATYDYVKKIRLRINLNQNQLNALYAYATPARKASEESLETWLEIGLDDVAKVDDVFLEESQSPSSIKEQVKAINNFFKDLALTAHEAQSIEAAAAKS